MKASVHPPGHSSLGQTRTNRLPARQIPGVILALLGLLHTSIGIAQEQDDLNRLREFLNAPKTDDIFSTSIVVEGIDQTTDELTIIEQGTSFDNVENLLDQYNQDELEALFPNFSENSSLAVSAVNYRGLPINLSYGPGGVFLEVSIPDIDYNRRFEEGSYDENIDAFKDSLENDTDNLLSDLVASLIANSPVEPVAGNPTSLMGQMVSDAFAEGMSPNNAQVGAPVPGEEPASADASNLVDLSVRFGTFRQGDNKVNSLTVPLGYTVRLDSDPRKQLIFSAPLTVTDAQGAQSYKAGVGVAYRFPVAARWSLTPAVNYGLIGSVDLGSVGHVLGGSMTSDYQILGSGYSINIGNMVGFYSTLPLTLDQYSVDPNVQNTVIKNGVGYTRNFRASRWLAQAFVTDTRFFGDELFAEQYNEVGFAVGSGGTGLKRLLRIGLTYLFGPDEIQALKANFGYSF